MDWVLIMCQVQSSTLTYKMSLLLFLHLNNPKASHKDKQTNKWVLDSVVHIIVKI